VDVSLLQMFTEAARRALVGRAIGQVRWCRPVLSVAVGNRNDGRYLTLILESPGPFCYISANDPLEAVPAPARFAGLAGAKITGVGRAPGERIVRVDTLSASETGGVLTLWALLFGSAGRVELSRPDGSALQHVGSRLQSRPGAQPHPVGTIPQGPFYLVSQGRIGRVTPSDTDDPGAPHRFGPFDEALAACEEVGSRILTQALERIVIGRTKPLKRQIGSRRKLLTKLRAELENAEDHQSLRREAENLAAYQASVEPGAESVQLQDVYAPDRRIEIKLDPSLPIRVQIGKRFKKATKLSRSLIHTKRRIEQVEREVITLEQTIAAVEGAPDFAAAMGQLDRVERTLPPVRPRSNAKSPPPGGKADQATPFRRFVLDDMWFVLVGRNNRENDELTFHTAAPSDLWFHAQQAAGSHVVLKCRGNPGAPPAHILEAAAAVAAHFSKSKHSGLAPVVYTERKYVRKFRGAKPGQVVCEREKTIIVAPGLPETKP
jgi:predicted ribosome quality control (RQC) complex YloA/Tae2 family protein